MVSHLRHNEISKMGVKMVKDLNYQKKKKKKDLNYLIRELVVVFLHSLKNYVQAFSTSEEAASCGCLVSVMGRSC